MIKIKLILPILLVKATFATDACFDMAKEVVDKRLEEFYSKNKLNLTQRLAVKNIGYNLDRRSDKKWVAYPVIINEAKRKRYNKDHQKILESIFNYNETEGFSLIIDTGDYCENYIPNHQIMNCLKPYGEASFKPSEPIKLLETAAAKLLIDNAKYNPDTCMLTIKDGKDIDITKLKLYTSKNESVSLNHSIKGNDLIINIGSFLNKKNYVNKYKYGNIAPVIFNDRLYCESAGLTIKFTRNKKAEDVNFCQIKEVLRYGKAISEEEYKNLGIDFKCESRIGKEEVITDKENRICEAPEGKYSSTPVKMTVFSSTNEKIKNFQCASQEAKVSKSSIFKYEDNKCKFSFSLKGTKLDGVKHEFSIDKKTHSCKEALNIIKDGQLLQQYNCEIKKDQEIFVSTVVDGKKEENYKSCKLKKKTKKVKIKAKKTYDDTGNYCSFKVYVDDKRVINSKLKKSGATMEYTAKNGECSSLVCDQKKKEKDSRFELKLTLDSKEYKSTCYLSTKDESDEEKEPVIPPLPPINKPFNVEIPHIPILLEG